jgi:putative ABC transport system ATP-binding protein
MPRSGAGMPRSGAGMPRSGAGDEVAARAVDARKVYGEGATAVHALDGVTIGFARGAFTAIMGPSGSGKSTLLHCLAGLDRLTSGSIFVGDFEISAASERELTLLRRDRFGFIFQAYNLIPTLDARENILLPLDLAKRKPDPEWFERVLTMVALHDRLSHRPDELSGGQQQRVAVARALVGKPELVFADEPTGNLDSRAGAEILGFMRRAVDELGQTIVMVTHDANAASRADRVVFLVDGRLVDEILAPTPDSVIDRLRILSDRADAATA